MRVSIRSVDVLRGFVVRLGFTDGSECTVDLEPYLHGPAFDPLPSDRAPLAGVRVDAKLGTIVWANGEEIAPEMLSEPRSIGYCAKA